MDNRSPAGVPARSLELQTPRTSCSTLKWRLRASEVSAEGAPHSSTEAGSAVREGIQIILANNSGTSQAITVGHTSQTDELFDAVTKQGVPRSDFWLSFHGHALLAGVPVGRYNFVSGDTVTVHLRVRGGNNGSTKPTASESAVATHQENCPRRRITVDTPSGGPASPKSKEEPKSSPLLKRPELGAARDRSALPCPEPEESHPRRRSTGPTPSQPSPTCLVAPSGGPASPKLKEEPKLSPHAEATGARRSERPLCPPLPWARRKPPQQAEHGPYSLTACPTCLVAPSGGPASPKLKEEPKLSPPLKRPELGAARDRSALPCTEPEESHPSRRSTGPTPSQPAPPAWLPPQEALLRPSSRRSPS
jgi:hypothetical protein